LKYDKLLRSLFQKGIMFNAFEKNRWEGTEYGSSDEKKRTRETGSGQTEHGVKADEYRHLPELWRGDPSASCLPLLRLLRRQEG